MDELIRKSDAVKAINSWLYCDEDERMPDEVIKALPPVYVPDMNDGDMISRQVAMEMLMAQNVIMDGSEYHNGFNAGVNRAQEVIRNLLSVQPERKTGRWTPDNTDYYRTKFICSVCGESEEVPTMGFGYVPMWGYCPNCGADMRGGEE